ncbi:Ldh family oxidoreductase [Streptomyces sp. NPDC059679]|uniref:Ldh family oxidoreductase n=1 Tax=Streptomyces sp. NPDC059679 TaxID=3346903 RepID=UPI0036CA7A31
MSSENGGEQADGGEWAGIAPETARTVAVRALTAHGVDDDSATVVADALVETSMRGVATHGLRLLPRYLDDLARGIANATPRIRVVRQTGATALVDADAALGVVAGIAGVREAVRRAAEHGVATVVVRNSNHFGAASVYSRAMAAAGMVGWAMTSAASRVAPCHGRTPLFGTNPISVAAGTDGEEFALDIATSQVCQGEIQERGRLGLPLEPGWATDARGHGTHDASAAVALSPLGASGAGHKGQGHKGQSYTGQGHKGQGLAMAVTLMTAVLADAPLDWELDHIGQSPDGRGRRVAHFLLCLDPAAFAGPDPFRRRLADLVATTRRAPAAGADPVLSPGDPERRRAGEAARHGIPLDPDTARALRALALQHGVDAPVSAADQRRVP